jgi:hypothetical protein
MATRAIVRARGGRGLSSALLSSLSKTLSDILKSQCPSTFTIESRHRKYFPECVECQTFSKVSALVHLLYKATIDRTFENLRMSFEQDRVKMKENTLSEKKIKKNSQNEL